MISNGMRRVHPGEILREDYQKQMGISTIALAKVLDVPEGILSGILDEHRRISADMAQRLANGLGTTQAFRLNLQRMYDSGSLQPTH